jgi:hypothetical protein
MKTIQIEREAFGELEAAPDTGFKRRFGLRELRLPIGRLRQPRIPRSTLRHPSIGDSLMTATVTESMPERPVKVFPESWMGRGTADHFVEAKVGFWSSLAGVAKGIITQLGKSAENGNYYVYAREPERAQGSGQATIWFGRMTLWPDRLWSNRSESNRFALEREIKRSRDELAYRGIPPK